MSKKIFVWIKEPGKKARHVWISNTMHNLQNIVGGYIESIRIGEDSAIICNEEGRLYGFPHNVEIMGIQFVGTIIFIGIDGNEFTDFPDVDMKTLFPQIFN